MSSRGVYRGVYSVLPDDPDFQRLSPSARLILYTARICRDSGPSAIFRYYATVLMAQTGLTLAQVERGLRELEDGRWIERDDAVLWIRNGLRYDPHISLADSKHRKGIERHLRDLPRSSIVLNFCDYYEITRPFEAPPQGPSKQGVGNRDKGVGSREPEKGIGLPFPPALAVGSVNGVEAWTGYREAYERRYGTEPVRNAKVNGQLKRFTQRIPAGDAGPVAGFYVGHNGALYVRAGHCVDLLLRDAEKLHTEWVTGRRITDAGARASDARAERGGIADRLLEKARQQREEAQHGGAQS